MPKLLDVQQAFAASILHGDDAGLAELVVEDGIESVDRLRIYRNTACSVLTDALRLTYPAIERLVGREYFDGVAAIFVREQPPGAGYLNDYGGGFAEFLSRIPSAAALPYLADVARFEWTLSVAANTLDSPVLGAMDLAHLVPEQHADLCFKAHASVTLLRLAHPADRIADAVVGRDDAAIATVDVNEGPLSLIVHRGPDGIRVERIDEDAYRFAKLLFAGKSLGSLVESFGNDAAPLLADQLGRGRIAGFRLANADQEIESPEKSP